MLFSKALRASTTHRYDYLHAYVEDLESVIDMAAIRDANVKLGVDPLGGAGIDYWPRIAERYGLNLTVVNDTFNGGGGPNGAAWAMVGYSGTGVITVQYDSFMNAPEDAVDFGSGTMTTIVEYTGGHKADAQSVASLLGVTDSVNFEGATIPTLRAVASASDTALWQRARPKLLAARQRRVQPAFDAKLVSEPDGGAYHRGVAIEFARRRQFE